MRGPKGTHRKHSTVESLYTVELLPATIVRTIFQACQFLFLMRFSLADDAHTEYDRIIYHYHSFTVLC
jgi:hypothetical protein